MLFSAISHTTIIQFTSFLATSIAASSKWLDFHDRRFWQSNQFFIFLKLAKIVSNLCRFTGRFHTKVLLDKIDSWSKQDLAVASYRKVIIWNFVNKLMLCYNQLPCSSSSVNTELFILWYWSSLNKASRLPCIFICMSMGQTTFKMMKYMHFLV